MESQAPEVSDLEQLWGTVLSDIELRISKPNFLTWLKNSRLIESTEGSALVALPNNFAKEWVETKYHKLILGSMRSINGTTKHVEYIVEGSLSQRAINRRRRETREHQDEKQLVFQEMRVDPETNLNPRHTLETFVVGSFNELAFSAAQAVIENVGTKYNPLFIYGGVGLGKTHLIQGNGNEHPNPYHKQKKKENNHLFRPPAGIYCHTGGTFALPFRRRHDRGYKRPRI